MPDIAAELYPFLPVRWLTRFDYNVQQNMLHVSCPVLVVHSRDDEIIPFRHGQALFETANEPKQFLELRGGHNDGFLVAGRTYTRKLDEFLSTWIQ